MDRTAMHKRYQRSNSEELERNVKLFIVIRKRNISIKKKLQKIQKLFGKIPQPNINAQDGNDNWNTALHLACKRNELEVVNFLLTLGANTAIENGDGKTPLDLAEECNHVQIIDVLKSHISQAQWLCSDFRVEEALEGADCFFDAVAQGMSALCVRDGPFSALCVRDGPFSALCVRDGPFNVQSLRQSCCDYARDNQDGIYDSQTGMTWLQVIAENACTGGYATGSGRQDDFESYLTKLKEDTAICGRPEIEGRMLCKIYGVKLHLLGKQTADGQDIISPQLVDSSGSRAVTMDESTSLYKEPGVIHILNEGQAHFVPILSKSLVQKELTEQRTHRPHSETESNSHAAAASKQAATTVLPPFSGELRVDTQLKLSDGDFKRRMEEYYENKQLSAINQLQAKPDFPTPYILARFASMAYTDYQREEPKPPDGWNMLTTASNIAATNGYFGTAYWHPELQQVVIAHRGTDPKNIGALVTDIKGVVFNNYVDQMSSASTFANKVVAVLQKIDQEKSVSFELFFTGHSLGGWLAQITNFTTKHLEEKDGIFLMILKTEEHEPPASSTVRDTQDVPHSYHPHTVVFDSPGCKDMLSQMTDKLDVRLHGRSIDLQHLDITSYLSAPNRINTCNSHLGINYRIFIDLSHMSSWRKRELTYTTNTHSMDKIVEAFDPETGQVRKDDKGELKIREVVDWPVSAGLKGGREYIDFFKLAKQLNNYHPDVMDTVFSNVPKGYNQLRYQSKAYDECARSLSIFTQDEREFLERYRWLCHVSEFFKPEDLFSVMNNTEVQQEAEQKLRTFELGNGSVRCPDASILQALIPYVKRLVRLFPHMKENIKDKLSSSQIRSRVYQYETQRYIEKIHQSALDFNPGALGLREFLTSDQQIWQLRMTDGGAWTGLTMVYRVFQQTSCGANYSSEGNNTVLKLKQLLKVNGMINLSTLLASMETPHLLMIACETIQPVNDELSEMFKELFNTLKHKKTMKVILTTASEDSTADFLQQTARETLGEGFKTTDEQLTWGDLTSSSQTKILEKAVIFQGTKVALNQLTSAESVTNSFPLADLLQETEIRIGKELVPSACSGYNETYYTDRKFHHNIVIRQDVSCDKRLGKFADLLAYDEQEFKQLCQQNPTRNVHWLVKDKSGDLNWQQSQGNLKTLRKYIDAQNPKSYGPKDLENLLEQARHHRVMLIADKAGMGKSTVLTHLSKQIKKNFPAHWLVRIDLNDYTELLEAQKGKKMDKERVLEFVSKEVLKLESRLEKELFKKNFEGNETNKVVIMFDGFDEISPRYKETVIDMLQVVKQTSLGQLWVTTRPHLREELEDNLQQLAYTLQPFSEVEQLEFLNKLWLKYLNLEATNQHRLEIYATALIRKLAQSISDKDKEFAGIPLQTRMLAEAFAEEFKSFYLSEKSEPELLHKLDLLGLYGRFIDKKYDIYYKEKCKIPGGNVAAGEQRQRDIKGMQLQHQLLALQALFTEDQVKRLPINYEPKFSDEQLARIGIVQRNHDGKLQFIHRTFAEYYVADFLINQLTKTTEQHVHVQEFLLNEVLLRTYCEVIRAFVDGLLEKSKPTKEALKEYEEKLDKQWNEREVLSHLTGLRETALHQAVTEDNINIIGFLVDSLKSGEHSNALSNMLSATDYWGRTAWHMAANEGSVDALQKIWECVYEVTPTVSGSLPVLKDTSDETAWHMAANEGSVDALQKIWECVDEVTPTVTWSLLELKDTSDETAPHLATKTGHMNSSEKPWNSAKEAQIYAEEIKKQMLLAQDSDGKTAWHMAAENCNEEILEKIWRWANTDKLRNELLLGRCHEGRTVWHVAAESGSVEILDKLWGWAKEAQLHTDHLKRVLFVREDRFKASTWGCAILNGSVDVLQNVWGWAEELRLTPNEMKSKLFLGVAEDGNTAIHPAEYGRRIRLLDRPWDSSKDKHSYTTIDWAAATGNIELLQTLWGLCKETQINTDEVMTNSLLAAWHRAAAGGYLQILDILCMWAAEVRLNRHEFKRTLLLDRNEDGENAWRLAAARGYVKVLEKLWEWAKEEQIKPDELKSVLFLTVLPPFSGELTVDTELKLSHDDFKHRIEEFYENKQLSAINQLKATPAFPTPHVLAQFASMVYTDCQREEPEPPDGWTLLTTASHVDILNGYFGRAYWQPEHQQVVIAHRGTDITNVGALVTDIKGVLFNNYVRQISSSSTFANKVVAVLQQIEQDNGVSFELFFTGHSLGGWLAQITTFTTKYLKEKDGIFLKRLKGEEHELLGSSTVQYCYDVPHSYHPHTVVFDSPGCKDMLSLMTNKLDVRLHGRSIDLQHLDITSYLSAPNLINTCNSHLGTVYRIFIDLTNFGFFSQHTSLYNLATHSMDKIVEAFDPETGQVLKDDKGELKIREVVDWPVSAGLKGDAEYNDFFKWAKHLNNYHPEVMDTFPRYVPNCYHQLRYQTKAYDECAKSLSIFTQDEREFLEGYRWLRHVPEVFKPEDLFCVMNNTEAQQEAEQKLRYFELDNESVRCPDVSTLQALIPYVKRLVRLFPHIKDNIRSWVYQYETQRYIETIHQSALDFNPGALGLREFFTSDQQIWHLRITDGDVWTGLTKVYQVLKKTSCGANCFSEGDCTVLQLKQLLKVNRMINLSTLLASMETPHLLMIACETNQPVNDELRDMFNELFSILKQKKTVKIIMTTLSEDSFAAFLQQIARATLGEGLKTTYVQLSWGDLTSSSQTKIFEKAVILQGRKVPLNRLTTAESVTNSFPLADLLQETEIRIGEELVPSACSGYNETYYTDRKFHHNIVIRQDVSCDKRLGKFADLLAYDEQEFKQLCQQNPTSNVHWLVKDKSGGLNWQQSQGNLKTLREYIDVQKSHSYGPKDLERLLEQARHHKIMLIADKAGMGKSTVLTHMSKQIKKNFPSHWLVRIDLNDCTGLLEAQKGKKIDKERVLEFVSKEVLKLESRLEKLLFTNNFEGNETNKVVIMFDGFDEISPRYKQTVIDMLQVLKQTSLGQLWVTTRLHLREELEDNLQQLAYTLQHFSEFEQVEFLNKFWLQYSNMEALNQHRLAIYATALIRKLAQSISDKDKEFAGIPLQTRMLAEAFEEDFKSFYLSEKSEPELPHKLDLLGLYGRFIDIKYDIYYKEKSKTPAVNMAAEEQREHHFRDIQVEHQLLALQALFTEDQVKRLPINHESKFSDEQLARIGIVQRNHDGKPQFIHRTFAEYYVAEFLINQLTKTTKQHVHVQEFLLNEVLLRTYCEVIRAFVDGLLEKSKPTKEALKDYGEKLDKQWNEREVLRLPTNLREIALCQAVREDNTNIIAFLVDSLKSGAHANALRKLLLATDIWGLTAWHMAAEEDNVRALKNIWDCLDEVTPLVTSSLPLLKDTTDETASHWATEKGHTYTVEKPWNSAKEAKICAKGLKKHVLLAKDWRGRTAWHLAAENCNKDGFEKTWQWAKQALQNPSELENTFLLGRDREGRVKGRVAVLKTLLAFAKETQLESHWYKNELVLAKDRYGNTVWHKAVPEGNSEVLAALGSWVKEAQLTPNELSELLLAKDMLGNTVWHAAAERGNSEVLAALGSWVKEAQLTPNELSELLLAKDKYGKTVCHAALQTGNLEMLEAFRSLAKEAQLKPNELSKLLVAEDKCGNTVWHAAVEGGNSEVLAALRSWVKEAELKPNKYS